MERRGFASIQPGPSYHSWRCCLCCSLVDALLDDQAEQKVLPAIVIACLAAPLIVVRWLWIASRSSAADPPSSTDQPVASWAGVLVWWVAFTVFWMSSRLALTMFEGSEAGAYSPGESAVRVMAMGTFEVLAGVAWATAAVFAVRIILRVTAMQDARGSNASQATA